MASKALFKYLPDHQTQEANTVSVLVNGAEVRMSATSSLAAGLLAVGVTAVRLSPVSHGARAPYCMMGVCFECMVEVNGRPNQQACLITPEDGMKVVTLQAVPSMLPAKEAKHV